MDSESILVHGRIRILVYARITTGFIGNTVLVFHVVVTVRLVSMEKKRQRTTTTHVITLPCKLAKMLL